MIIVIFIILILTIAIIFLFYHNNFGLGWKYIFYDTEKIEKIEF